MATLEPGAPRGDARGVVALRGRELAPLRDEEVLVVGGGNLVHDLHTYARGTRPVTFPAEGFDAGSLSMLSVAIGSPRRHPVMH
jgi:aromatic ring-opening dioxygenase catalytic subunit (LigB family)